MVHDHGPTDPNKKVDRRANDDTRAESQPHMRPLLTADC